MLWIVFFGLLAVLAALPILAERRRYAVTEAQRRAAPGGTAVLSGGKTHYRWFGSDGQPVMVLIHGLTGASFIWEGLAPLLAGSGARVLVYDVFGRGLSDRPGTAQTRAFFIRQLRELLQDQGIEGDITLVGYSMGGSIATVFAAEEAERVERLILIAPSGLARTARPAAEFCRRTFWLGDWAMTVFGGIALRREPVAAPSSVPDLAARMANETRMRGYLRSVLSSMRNLLAERLDEDHAEVKRMYVPTLAIWGEQDQTIPIQALGELARANRDARQVTLPAAGHGLVHTHPKEINQAIQGFLKEL
jgi:pimeloyl-ACP methyl ester carboxylesterase